MCEKTIAANALAQAADVLKSLAADGYLAIKTYLGDTANANLTQGLTLNQAANDDEILALKSSDIAHGVTDLAETDTYASFLKHDGSTGGLQIRGYSENVTGVNIVGVGVNDNTTKGTGASAPVTLQAWKKSGTGADAPGADANAAIIKVFGAARFIFDGEGSAHADVEWTTFDAHNDAALLTGLELALLDPVKGAFGAFMDDNRARLQQLKIVTFNEDGHHFVNFTRLAMLHTGAIRQTAARVEALEAKVNHLLLTA